MDRVALIIRVDIMDVVMINPPLHHHHLHVAAIGTVLMGNVALILVYVVTVLKLQPLLLHQVSYKNILIILFIVPLN